MTIMVKKKKAEKVKPKRRWWKLKEKSCQKAFMQEWNRILGGENGLFDEWDKTAEEFNCVSREEVKNALRRMKKGKAVGQTSCQ